MSDANQKNIEDNIARLKNQLADKLNALVTAAPGDKERIKQERDDLKKLIREFEAEMNDLPKAEQGVTISNNDNSSTTENYSMNTSRDGHIIRLGDITSRDGNVNVMIQLPGQEIRENPISLPIDQNSDPIYIKRPNLERLCYESIQKSPCLLRIAAPQQMGKTMLINYITSYAERELNYKTIKIDFRDPMLPTVSNNNNFLSLLCLKLSEILSLGIDQHDESNFLYLLERMPNNLVLALDHFELLIETTEVCVSIGRLLRSWHEKQKPDDTLGQIWRKLRIIMAYSTTKFPDFPPNESPFNVGDDVGFEDGLRGFSQPQVKNLLSNYERLKTRLSDEDLKSLVEFLNGHPQLIQQSLRYLNNQEEETMTIFLRKSSSRAGIFASHLSLILTNHLQPNKDLMADYKEVLIRGSVRLSPDSFTRLNNLGLTVAADDNNDSISSCDLYRKYFYEELIANSDQVTS
jgi:hypothetical protein